MAIYHLHVKVIGRKSGSSAVASAAYRSGSRLRDERLDRSHDFSAKRGVVHSEVMLPENAPEAWSDRERLWNDVEAFEVRKDAQLAREVEFAIPREMTQAQGIELARDFVRGRIRRSGHDRRSQCALGHGRGRHAQTPCPCHADHARGGRERFWPEGAGLEPHRRWSSAGANAGRRSPMSAWPNSTSTRASTIAASKRRASRWSRKARSARPPDVSRIGASRAKAIEADRAEMHREIARNNGARIIADPSLGLDAITHQQSTFTRRDMARFAHRHSDGIDQFNEVMGAMRGAPDLVELGKDARGEDRFTTREMIEAERRLHHAAELMAERERHEVRDTDREAALGACGSARSCPFGRAGRCAGAYHGRARSWDRGRPCRNGKERDAGRGAGGLGSGRL